MTWLKLQRVEPSLLEPGVTLRIGGAGFPVDQACELRLRGRTYRPGLQSVVVEARLPARALSDEEVASVLDGRTWSALGGRGSFEGELSVECRAPRAGRSARGALHSRLDLVPPIVRTAYQRRLREGARRLLDSAGIVLADEEPTLLGLIVASVHDPSPASILGLRRGDAIVRASGVSIRSLEDFAPPPGVQRVQLHVKRSGLAAPLALDLVGLRAPELSAELTRLTVLLAWLFACLLLLSPVSFSPWLVRAVRRLRHGPPAVTGLWGGPRQRPASRKRKLSRLLPALLLPSSLSALGVLVICFELPQLVSVRWLSAYLGFAALSITLVLMSDQSRRLVRLRAAAGSASRMLAVGVLIACACALEGTRSLDAMMRMQEAWPWHWALLQEPILYLALPLYVACASALGGATVALEPAGTTAKLLVVERVLVNVVLSALGVAIFAGGWRCPAGITLDGFAARLLGAVCFVLETWGFGWLLSFVRRLGLPREVPLRAIALGCFTTAALTAAWLRLDPPPEVALVVGRALGAGLAIAALVTAVRTRVSSWPAPQESA